MCSGKPINAIYNVVDPHYISSNFGIFCSLFPCNWQNWADLLKVVILHDLSFLFVKNEIWVKIVIESEATVSLGAFLWHPWGSVCCVYLWNSPAHRPSRITRGYLRYRRRCYCFLLIEQWVSDNQGLGYFVGYLKLQPLLDILEILAGFPVWFVET